MPSPATHPPQLEHPDGRTPGGRRARCAPGALTLACAVALAALAGVPGRAAGQGTVLRTWSFEQSFFGRLTCSISDHCYLYSDGLWHFFYTHLGNPEEPQVFIGHAVSANLRDWTEHAPAVVASLSEPPWRSLEVWAPMVTAWPGGGWVMAFTGYDYHAVQRIGFLHSDDLETWTDLPGSVPFEPDTSIYEWVSTEYSNCRDPHLIQDGGLWHLLFAARNKANLGVVGHATSPDLLTWTQYPPLLTASGPRYYLDLESPCMIRNDGSYVLTFGLGGVYAIRADSLLGPWQVEDAAPLDEIAAGGELVPGGAGLFFSRQRMDQCDPAHEFIVLADSLDASSWPYHIVPWSRPPDFTVFAGDAFLGQPSFGDAPGLRGEPPADPSGLFWMSSREFNQNPWLGSVCTYDRGGTPTGEVRSAPFYLGGDTLALRVNGASSPDSAYAQVCDACTGTQLFRFSATGPTLEPRSAYAGAVRARSVQWRVVDGLSRPGGWIGVDELQERASPGLPQPPAPPLVTWTLPVGGENFVRLSRITLKWQVSDASAQDSLVLYLTYDGGETLRRVTKLAGSDRQYRWRVADTLATAARLRLIVYSHSGASSCATSQAFDIVGSTTDADTPAGAGGLHALYRAGEAWLEGSVPMGGGPGTLELFDLRGRRLALLWRGPGGESFRVVVSRAAEGGARLARGIYFARLAAGGRAWTTRVALLSPDRQ